MSRSERDFPYGSSSDLTCPQFDWHGLSSMDPETGFDAIPTDHPGALKLGTIPIGAKKASFGTISCPVLLRSGLSAAGF